MVNPVPVMSKPEAETETIEQMSEPVLGLVRAIQSASDGTLPLKDEVSVWPLCMTVTRSWADQLLPVEPRDIAALVSSLAVHAHAVSIDEPEGPGGIVVFIECDEHGEARPVFCIASAGMQRDTVSYMLDRLMEEGVPQTCRSLWHWCHKEVHG